MTKIIINLTLPAVVTVIEDILETYPDHPYQQAFSIPNLRQELIAHILSRVSSRYVVVEEEQIPCFGIKSLPFSPQEKFCLEALIQEEIESIIRQKEEEVSQQIPEEVDPRLEPSHWFG
ncbi:MAG: hypothetical protein QNJ51_02495 [Calothrix sp. MO_167.B12]|nr:hypothetical protein [Calothrix sp. MO_167.B12]